MATGMQLSIFIINAGVAFVSIDAKSIVVVDDLATTGARYQQEEPTAQSQRVRLHHDVDNDDGNSAGISRHKPSHVGADAVFTHQPTPNTGRKGADDHVQQRHKLLRRSDDSEGMKQLSNVERVEKNNQADPFQVKRYALGFGSSRLDGLFVYKAEGAYFESNSHIMYKDPRVGTWKIVEIAKKAQVLGNGPYDANAWTTCNVLTTISCGDFSELLPDAQGTLDARSSSGTLQANPFKLQFTAKGFTSSRLDGFFVYNSEGAYFQSDSHIMYKDPSVGTWKIVEITKKAQVLGSGPYDANAWTACNVLTTISCGDFSELLPDAQGTLGARSSFGTLQEAGDISRSQSGAADEELRSMTPGQWHVIGDFSTGSGRWTLDGGADIQRCANGAGSHCAYVSFASDCSTALNTGRLSRSIATKRGFKYDLIFHAAHTQADNKSGGGHLYLRIDSLPLKLLALAHYSATGVQREWNTMSVPFTAAHDVTSFEVTAYGSSQPCVVVKDFILRAARGLDESNAAPSEDASWQQPKLLMQALALTGCPNRDKVAISEQTWANWRDAGEEGALSLMWKLCDTVQLGLGQADQIAECCGRGSNCKPQECRPLLGVEPGNTPQSMWLDLSGANTHQSSTVEDHHARRAIDGKLGTDPSGKACTKTDPLVADPPWWQVELSTTWKVQTVKITSPSGTEGAFGLSPFTIFLDNEKCASDVFIKQGDTKSVPCKGKASLVKIMSQQPLSSLQICEVAIEVTFRDVRESIEKEQVCNIDMTHTLWEGTGDIDHGILQTGQYLKTKFMAARPSSVSVEMRALARTGGCLELNVFPDESLLSPNSFMQLPKGKNQCPPHTNRIYNEAQCLAAARALELPYDSGVTKENFPAGCYSKDKKIFFNDNLIGSPHQKAKLVCQPENCLSIQVTSVDHPTGVSAKYFNFNRMDLPTLRKNGNQSLIVYNTRTSKDVEVEVFGQSAGGSTGDAYGRHRGNLDAGYFEVGDVLATCSKRGYGVSTFDVLESGTNIGEPPQIFLRLNEKSGEALDSSPPEAHTSRSFTSTSWEPEKGRQKGALRFKGENGHQFAVDFEQQMCANGCTVSLWVKLDATEDVPRQGLLCVGAGGAEVKTKSAWCTIEPVRGKGNLECTFPRKDNPKERVILAPAVPALDNETWYHFTITWNARGFLNMYWQGAHVASTQHEYWRGMAMNPVTNQSQIVLGSAFGGMLSLTGLVDDVMVWDSELDEDKISRLYTDGLVVTNPKTTRMRMYANNNNAHQVNVGLSGDIMHTVRLDTDNDGSVRYYFDGKRFGDIADGSVNNGHVSVVARCSPLQIASVQVSDSNACSVPTRRCFTRMPISRGDDKWRGTGNVRTGVIDRLGQYLESRATFARPFRFTAEVQAHTDQCFAVSLFPVDAEWSTGYSVNFADQLAVTPSPHFINLPSFERQAWNTVQIYAKENGKVAFYINGRKQLEIRDDRLTSGRIIFAATCTGITIRNVVAHVSAECHRSKNMMHQAV